MHPLMLLLAVALPAVLLVARRRLRAGLGSSVWGGRAVLLARVCLLAALVLALAEPEIGVAGRERVVLFAVDVSDSMAPGQRAWATSWVQQAVRVLPSGSRWSVEQFAAQPRLAGASDADAPPGNETDLAAALRLAAASLGGDTRPEIVLLTDGWDTTGAGVSPSQLPAGVVVSYAAPPPTDDALQAVVHAVDLPAAVRVGDAPDVVVQIAAAAPGPARLRLIVDDTPLSDAEVQLQAGTTRVPFTLRIGTPGFHQVGAELTLAGRTSRLSAVTVASDAGQVLLLEDQPGQAAPLATVLSAAGIRVERRPATTIPPSAVALAGFDAVVLVNTPATSLTLDQQRTLQAFARELGHGLLVVGGPRSFSPGGYEGSVLDEVLPVSAQPPVAPRQGNLALFLVVDRSGSMEMGIGGSSKIAMARTAASHAAEMLQPNDTLGVIAFDSTFQWIVPRTTLRGPDDVRAAELRIESIQAGGGTSILPPLAAAMEAAAGTDAALKHVVLLTDGESDETGYEALLARMAPRQVTLSTLAIGSDADRKLLASLARLGGGRSYFTERSTQIPLIAAKEATILTRNAVVEGQASARVGEPSPLLRALSGSFPALGGYVATSRKDQAVTALETERGDPLLAHWQYGLGRVAAWTSEAQQGWGGAWAGWGEAARFWPQVVRWLMPAPQRSDLQVTARVLADGRRVTLRAQSVRDDGTFGDQLDTRATIVGPDGAAHELPLPQQAPGTYELTTTLAEPGVYRVLVAQREAGQVVRQELAGFAVPDSAELHTVGVNRGALATLAAHSGGRELRAPQDVASGSSAALGSATVSHVPLWPWLLLLALLLLPLDVYLRRTALGR